MKRFEGGFSLYKFLRSEVGKVSLADRRLTGRLDSRQSLYLTYSLLPGPPVLLVLVLAHLVRESRRLKRLVAFFVQ